LQAARNAAINIAVARVSKAYAIVIDQKHRPSQA
jgi:hypothetical protein